MGCNEADDRREFFLNLDIGARRTEKSLLALIQLLAVEQVEIADEFMIA